MQHPGLRLHFLGAAETVTGSRYLVETPAGRVLVDCGLFQGLKRLRERNWEPFPMDPTTIHAVVLTHAHLDHSGYLPRLCREGFRGKIHCTEGTRDLLEILLPDSGRLQEEQARHANKWKYSKHHPAQPLYGEDEALACLDQIETVRYHQEFSPCPGFNARFTRAGHILGSASLRLEASGRSILFSGDLGRPSDPVMKPAEPPPRADVLVVESTYGERLHPPEDVPRELERILRDTAARGGVLMIPAFAVGRVQHLLHILAGLRREGRIPNLPVFLNSPMGVRATETFLNHPEDHTLTPDECRAMEDGVTYTRSVDESKALQKRKGPLIVIAGSGMATGGRILHHFAQHLPDPNAGVLFVGYQAPGTRGHSLVGGATEVKLQGRFVPVRARIDQIEGLSAHADAAEILAWIRSGEGRPAQVFVTHGEPSAADALRVRLRDALGCEVTVPKDGSVREWSSRG